MLKVASKPCDQCLFSKRRIVSLERKEDIIKGCLEEDKHFECHKGTIADVPLVCAGWYKRFDSGSIRLAKHLNLITLVDPNKL